MTHTVTDVLGVELLVTKFYGDGSYDCPHCGYPIRADEGFSMAKHNPWCFATPGYPPDKAADEKRKRAEKQAEEERRQRDHEEKMRFMAEWNRTQNEERTAKLRDAEAQGYCVACLVRSGFRKTVRHRKQCPAAR